MDPLSMVSNLKYSLWRDLHDSFKCWQDSSKLGKGGWG